MTARSAVWAKANAVEAITRMGATISELAARIIFRALIGVTLLVMAIARYSGGRLPIDVFPPFYYWFVISVFVFGAFGLISAWRAWREPQNRRAYLFDVMLAAAWVPYWLANFR